LIIRSFVLGDSTIRTSSVCFRGYAHKMNRQNSGGGGFLFLKKNSRKKRGEFKKMYSLNLLF